MNCNWHLLFIAPLIEGEPELTSTEIQQVYTLTREPSILHPYAKYSAPLQLDQEQYTLHIIDIHP